MKDLLDKISSYNLFNYLLPGVLFALLADGLTSYTFIQSDIVVGIFLYYFMGLVISRVGSLAIEPILKKRLYEDILSKRSFMPRLSRRCLLIAETVEELPRVRNFETMIQSPGRC